MPGETLPDSMSDQERAKIVDLELHLTRRVAGHFGTMLGILFEIPLSAINSHVCKDYKDPVGC